MTDTNAFLTMVSEKGIKLEKIAETCNMSPSSLRNKVHNRTKFYIEEVHSICELLNLSDDDMMRIFFAK